MHLVLASGSPRRAALLRAAGFACEICEAGIAEGILPRELPGDYVRRVAGDKSATVARKMLAEGQGVAGVQASELSPTPERVVVGADTAVVVDGDILGKPSDVQEATAMLRRLSGRTHQVLTGLSVRAPGFENGCVEATVVRFRSLSEAEFLWHAAAGEWADKAGGYAIQGLASRFVDGIDGSYSNVVGLPLAALCRVLADVIRRLSKASVA